MALALAQYQDAFAHALTAADPLAGAPPQLAHLIAQPGFTVYRNTLIKGCVDALQANYPAVVRVVGEEWFRAAAVIYARQRLPSQPVLLAYGHRFAEFLAHFGPAAELPYLPQVAQLDRLWTEVHCAPDHDVLDPGALAHLTVDAMTRLTLRPHPAAQWSWFPAQPIFTLWSRNRDPAADHSAAIAWHGEGVLLTRPDGAVVAEPLTQDGVAFLDACAAGRSIQNAVTAAIAVDASADVSRLINQTLRAGAFAGLHAANLEESL